MEELDGLTNSVGKINADGPLAGPKGKGPRAWLRVAIWIAVCGIAMAMGVGGYEFYKKWRLEKRYRHVREYRARLAINDLPGAITALRSHILENPHDAFARRELADVLESDKQPYVAMAVFEQMLLEPLRRDEDSLEYSRAALSFSVLRNTQCDRLESLWDHALKEQNYVGALAVCDSLLDLADKDVKYPYPEVVLKNYDKYPTAYEVSLGTWKYNSYIARCAYTYWLMEDTKSMESSLLRDAWIGPIGQDRLSINAKARFEDLANHIEGTASSLFEEKRWAKAQTAYSAARDMLLRAEEQVWTDEVARCQMNMAICSFNQKSHRSARELLDVLKLNAPDYHPAEVEELLRDSRSAGDWNVYENKRSRAHKLFEEKSWAQAIAAFDDAARVVVERLGLPDTSELHEECRYNMAMAYFNLEGYSDAKRILIDIKAKSPNYEPLLIEQQLKQTQKMIDVFEK